MLYYIFFFNILFINLLISMADVAQLGVQLFTAGVQAQAEAKLRTEGFKNEIIQTQKAMVALVDKERVKTNNLLKISEIKNELIRRIQFNRDNYILIINSLLNVIYTKYKYYLSGVRQLINKYNQLVNDSKNSNVIFQICILSIESSFNQYINLLKKYNYDLQNINQNIQTNNQFNSVYVENPEDVTFVNSIVDVKKFAQNIENFISSYDNQSDAIIRSRDLLSNNNFTLLDTITKQILNTITTVEMTESSKDINNPTAIFYDLSDELAEFKNKLFGAFNQYEDSQDASVQTLYKILVLLGVNNNKNANIILYIDKVLANNNYSENNFIQDLYQNFLNIKKIIVNNKNLYFSNLKKNDDAVLSFVAELKEFLLFLIDNTNQLDLSILNIFMNKVNVFIDNYYNQISIKNKIINQDIGNFINIDEFLLDLQSAINDFKKNNSVGKNVEDKSNVSSVITNFNALSHHNAYKLAHSGKKNTSDLIHNMYKGDNKTEHSGNKIGSKQVKKTTHKKNKKNRI